MSMSLGRRPAASTVFLVLLGVLLGGCAAPAASPPIVRDPAAQPVIVTTAPRARAEPVLVDLEAGGTVRRDWLNAPVTAGFCGVEGAVRLEDGIGEAASTLYGKVVLIAGDVSYGTMSEPLREVAAVPISCNNGGGTGAGDLDGGIMIVSIQDRRLVAVGEITPQTVFNDRARRVVTERIGGDAITVTEYWYRNEDATCCSSGRAEVRWTYADGVLKPGAPHITK
jgi:hypothetical protein